MKATDHWGSIQVGNTTKKKESFMRSLTVERIDSRIFTKKLYKEYLTTKHMKREKELERTTSI